MRARYWIAPVLFGVACGAKLVEPGEPGLDASTVDAGVHLAYDAAVIDAQIVPSCGPDASVDDAETTEVGGPCVDGMECETDPRGCRDTPTCACVHGVWSCNPSADPDRVLPTKEPTQCGACLARNFACSVPSRDGVLCACFLGHWECRDVGAAKPCPVLADAGDSGAEACFRVDCDTIKACDCQER